MKFSQFLAILRARWLILAGTLLFFITLAVLAGLMMAKKYTATAAVLVDSRSPDPITGVMSSTSASYISTQMDIIRSERVALKVVKELKLDDNKQLRSIWQAKTGGMGSFPNWITDLLLDNLDVRPTKDSSVISVSYVGADPTFAAAIANAFVDAYIDTSLELRVEPAKQFNQMFQMQLKQSRDRIDSAQTKLSEFQQAKGITAADERMDVETARLNELSSTLVSLQTQSAGALSRTGSTGLNSPDAQASPVISTLKADLARQEAKLKELSARYGDQYPAIAETRSSIAELKQRIVDEARSVNLATGATSQISRDYEARIRAQLNAQRERVLQLKAVRDEALMLQRDVDSAQRAYDAILARANQSVLESSSNQTNVSSLKVAVPPLAHSAPRPILYILQAIFVGLFLGIAMAMAVEMRNRRIRSTEDIEDLIGIDLLGRMPDATATGGISLPIKFAPRLPARALLQLPSASK